MRRVISFLILFVGIGITLYSCEAPLPPEVVAEIDSDRITVTEFTEELRFLVEGSRTSASPEGLETIEEFKIALLDHFIEKMLMLREARKMDITVSDEEVDQRLVYVKNGYPEERFDEILQGNETFLSQWKESLRQRLLIEKLINRIVENLPPLDESAVRDYYEMHRGEFTLAEQVRVRHIVVHDLKTAEEIVKKVNKGESFSTLAQRYSIGPEAEEGGDLGFFGRGEMPEEFDVVFSLEVEEVSSVAQSPYGYHIFKVVEKRGGIPSDFREVEGRVRTRMVREREESAVREWLMDKRNQTRIKVNERALKHVGATLGQEEG